MIRTYLVAELSRQYRISCPIDKNANIEATGAAGVGKTKATAYFMDSIEYTELPEFFKKIDRQITDK